MSNKRLYSNNAKTTLATPLYINDTSISVVDGSRFPTPVDGDYFLVTVDAGASKEIIKVFTRSGNTFLNCERGQEGTIPSAYGTGVRVENRDTAATLASFARKEDRLGDIDSVDMIPKTSTVDANSYLTKSKDDSGTPIIAVRNEDTWNFLSHPFVAVSGTVTSDSTTLALTSLNVKSGLSDIVAGKYLIRFKTGPNAGVTRIVTFLDTSSVGWVTPLEFPNLYGVTFDVLQSSFSRIKEGTGTGGGNSSLDIIQKPSNVLPTSGSANTGTGPTLVGSTFYSLYGKAHTATQFQIATTPDFLNPTVDNVVVSSSISWNVSTALALNTVYYWRLRYRDEENNWSQYSNTSTFSTGSVVVVTPQITSPLAGSTGVPTKPTFTSSSFSVVGGTDVHLSSDWQVWTGPNGTGVKIFESLANTTSKTALTLSDSLTSLTTYYVRVRHNGTTYGASGWSGSISFSTSGLIGKPSIVQPVNGATGVGENALLQSSAFSVAGSTDSHAFSDWQIWTGANGTGTKVWELLNSTVSKTSVSIPPGLLTVNTTYYPRVRYTGASLPASDWSTGASFVTADTFFRATAGEPYEGGYYVGAFKEGSTTYALIVAGKSSEPGPNGNNGNTVIGDTHFYADQLNSQGYAGQNDWKIPTYEQLEMVYRYLKPSAATTASLASIMHGYSYDPISLTSTVINNGINNSSYPVRGRYDPVTSRQTEVAAFQTGGDQALDSSGTLYSCTGTIQGLTRFVREPNLDEACVSIRFSDGAPWYTANPTYGKYRVIRKTLHPDIVIRPSIDTLALTTSVNGDISLLVSTPYAFVGATNATHFNSDWEVWTGPNGTGTLVYQSLADSNNRISISMPVALVSTTTYYPRVRHRATSGATSSWSSSIGVKPSPSTVGMPFGGGYFVGRMQYPDGNTYALIVAPKAGGETTSQYRTYQDVGSYSSLDDVATQDAVFAIANKYGKDATDGWANTNKLKTADYPANAWARSLTIGGYNDWYVPSDDELYYVYTQLKPTTRPNQTTGYLNGTPVASYSRTLTNITPQLGTYTENNPPQTSVAVFKELGTEALSAERYLSSTVEPYLHLQGSSNGIATWIYFINYRYVQFDGMRLPYSYNSSPPGFVNVTNLPDMSKVRAVRKVLLG